MAVIVSILAGGSVVLSRTVNAALAEKTSLLRATLYNYTVGLLASVLVLLVSGELLALQGWPAFSPQVWIYLGGVLGVLIVTLSNGVVKRISSFTMTVLMFIGQVFTGIVLDMLLTRSFSWGNLIGGLLVTVGMALNLLVEREEGAAGGT